MLEGNDVKMRRLDNPGPDFGRTCRGEAIFQVTSSISLTAVNFFIGCVSAGLENPIVDLRDLAVGNFGV